jgi:hypothetical protein
MIAHVTFDAYASAYEINGELYYLKSKPGVQSVRLLTKKEGEGPRYCLEITAEDDAAEEIKKEMDRAKSTYSSQVSNFKYVTYTAL